MNYVSTTTSVPVIFQYDRANETNQNEAVAAYLSISCIHGLLFIVSRGSTDDINQAVQ